MQKKTTIASVAAALILGAAMSAGAQTATNATTDVTPSASAPRSTEFPQTRRVLAMSNLCEWYRTGGVTWDYAGQQTVADWTAATQAVTGELRKSDPAVAGDRLARIAGQRITELCAEQGTHTAGSI